MLSEPNISYKPFWGICRPLNSWRANSPNPIQIYCATTNHPLTPYDTLLHYYSHKDLFHYECYLNHTYSSMPFLNQGHADTETYCHT